MRIVQLLQLTVLGTLGITVKGNHSSNEDAVALTYVQPVIFRPTLCVSRGRIFLQSPDR